MKERMNWLSASILAADCACLGDQIRLVKQAGGRCVHIDVMDGRFVPSLSFGMCVVESLRRVTDLMFDVHLMVEEPIRYVEAFRECGADLITVHLEACRDVGRTLEKIRGLGCKAGLSIKPGTPVERVWPYLGQADLLLIMTVEPGFGGQSYIPASTQRIRTARQYIRQRGLDVDIQVDGGITLGNLAHVLEAGANVIVAGSAVFHGDVEANVKAMLDVMGRPEADRW